MKTPGKKPVAKGGFVYAKYITLRNGRRLYASAYGLKAFRFRAK